MPGFEMQCRCECSLPQTHRDILCSQIRQSFLAPPHHLDHALWISLNDSLALNSNINRIRRVKLIGLCGKYEEREFVATRSEKTDGPVPGAFGLKSHLTNS